MIAEQPKGLDSESDKLSRRLVSQQKSLEKYGFTSNKHQREVGSEYYEKVSEILSKSAEYKT